jgi:hypothetical protein
MNFMTADETLLGQLQGVAEPLEIREPSGKVLGIYTPLLTPEEAALYEQAKQLFASDDMDDAAEEPDERACTLEELLRRLRAGEEP